MSIIIEQTKAFLNREWPAVKNWLPCKEQQIAGATTDLADYAKGMELAGTRDLYKTDAATVFANIVTGTVGQGNDFYDASGDAVGFLDNVAADEHFIALCISDNQDDANSYNWIGKAGGQNGLRFADAGNNMTFRDANATITDTTVSIAVGIVCQYMGFNRTTNTAEFSEITSAGSVSVKREVDASAFDEAAILFGSAEASNGFSIYGGSSGTNPLSIYTFVMARFKGDYPVWEGDGGFGAELVTWRSDVVAGNKRLPSFLKAM